MTRHPLAAAIVLLFALLAVLSVRGLFFGRRR
jgi:hypothetical protein